MRHEKQKGSTTHTPDDMLATLLEAEDRLAVRLDAARDEAGEIVRRARDAAGLADDTCAATIEERVRRLESRRGESLRAALAEIVGDADRRAAAFSAFDEAGIAALVDFVVERVLRIESPEPTA